MNILFIHQNFPGQFKHIAPALVEAGHNISALVLGKIRTSEWKGVKLFRYTLERKNAEDAHPWTIDFESKVIRGEACLRASLQLRKKGFRPEVIVAHPGWGESLFLHEVWPDAKIKLYFEFFYHARGLDAGFDPEFSPSDPMDAGRVMLKNANTLLHFQNIDSALCPTHWQASTFPAHMQNKITIIHDGIDTDALIPNSSSSFTLPSGQKVTPADEVVTFVSRALEPYRGFHIFMRSLPRIIAERPGAQILIVGKEGISYGPQPSDGVSWKTRFSMEVFQKLSESDRARVHFLDTIPYDQFKALLQVSSAHVYLTYPFVLSWSLLEAMSTGCAIVASNTDPVREAITHNETGLLVDFFNPEALSNAIIALLIDSSLRARLGTAARNFAVSRYDLKSYCLPRQMSWVLNRDDNGN